MATVIIRDAVMRQFSDLARERFESKTVALLQEVYDGDDPDSLSPQVLRPRVHHIVDRALSHGIDHEADVTAFVLIAFEVGDDFDTDPDSHWAREILADPQLDSREKIEAMQSVLDEVQTQLADDSPIMP
jgi:hypothetical protein